MSTTTYEVDGFIMGSTEQPDDRLYGHEHDDEWLQLDLHDAIVRYWDVREGDFPMTTTFYEHSVLPKGDSGASKIWDGSDIAIRVAEAFCEDAGFEDLGDGYDRAAKSPDVVAAFQAAVDLMVSKQTFLVADRVIKKYTVTIQPDGDYVILKEVTK